MLRKINSMASQAPKETRIHVHNRAALASMFGSGSGSEDDDIDDARERAMGGGVPGSSSAAPLWLWARQRLAIAAGRACGSVWG